jgi:hypothetical protein
MSDSLAGFPFWTLQFDKNGVPSDAVASFLSEVKTADLSDLFIFSHGWNNDQATALDLYTRFFTAVKALLNDPAVASRPGAKAGVAGVLWPSILFPGDTPPAADAGGASSFSDAGQQPTLESELPKAFCDPDQQAAVQELAELLASRPPTEEALLSFRDKLRQIITPPQLPSQQDDLESLTGVTNDQWFDLLNAAAQPTDDEGGAASLNGPFERLWGGAKNVLRVATYWEMKNRAGVIGKGSLGPLLGTLHTGSPALRIHLVGHSFGARLVSYALAGLPDGLSGEKSPVKMLFLLQGAFSHFAFAEKLPFDGTRSGDLNGMAQRVDGPLLATFSSKDTAVGVAYPAAAVLAGQDASDATDLMYRWEGMGCDGAQEVDAAIKALEPFPVVYPFKAGEWLNLDGNEVIIAGGPPSGAHSDIVHPETAWVVLAASRMVT